MVLSLAANNLSNSRESPLFIKHARQHLLSAFDKNILLLLFQKANSKCHDEDLDFLKLMMKTKTSCFVILRQLASSIAYIYGLLL